MNLNLNEARRLHDRDEYYPDKCGTCGDANAGTLANWPCPTATALGATGRSEWTNEAAPLCAHGISYNDACTQCAQLAGTTPIQDTCATTGTTESGPSQCVLTTRHHGDHTAPNGLIIEPATHGVTVDPRGVTIVVCGEPHPDNAAYHPFDGPYICLAPPKHAGNHLDRDGDTW